ncbi:hypothetical protein SAMN04244553_1942 [Nocardia amikacinitolerans]|uniref:Uncharacterized protein n=1 Tax=Nocardia amikacinitolerans TaxID=756689 RepID=A0A285L606_9NOCA|nr:hypothetical protein [Nocardia amikacinitolerans]SNY80380.1 hypothetical protein SAMN04244553_1942 [Nocardia amikacinitolerans]
MTRKTTTRKTTTARYDDNVIDLVARRRCQLEARGLDPLAIAVNLLIETGSVPAWDIDDYGPEAA